MDNYVFTASAVLHLLTEIEELKDLDISISESDNQIRITVGDSTYNLEPESSESIEVPKQAVEDISTANEDEYQELADSGDIEVSQETITSGLISGLIKTILLGGMLKLAPKLMK